ncbi:MAG TPA: hypothetical protein VHR41_07305 [Gemmatimonadales bacterium]|nr:hypothetical protein [Gemmatimonadales bacterium]
MSTPRADILLLGIVGLSLAGSAAEAQGYRLRLDSRAQRVSYRGVAEDSIPRAAVVTGPTGGLETPDGFAVRCPEGGASCYFFRPGREVRGAPMISSADLVLWGLGVRGLSVRMNGRFGVDLGDSEVWPGTEPAVQLIEAYAEYAHPSFTVRGGRQLLTNRLGVVGFDGGHLAVRSDRRGLEADVYVGLGLARATALPVTSPVLNPLDDFQPRRRQLLTGIALMHSGRLADVRADYQREIDREDRNFVSERAALALDLRPGQRWSITAGADYDLANTWFGNAEAVVRYTTPWVTVAGGARQYRPYFDLWTIWGAFSPVPYHAVNAATWVRPARGLELRARWEGYEYSKTETETPLVDVGHDGWRFGTGVTYSPSPAWTVDAGYREESGPGAASHGFEGSVTFISGAALSLTGYASTLDRPLEFRFDDASADAFGFDAEWRPTGRLRIGMGLARYTEDRARPDAAAFDWDQTRLNARVTLLLRSDADAVHVPPALRGRSRAGSR